MLNEEATDTDRDSLAPSDAAEPAPATEPAAEEETPTPPAPPADGDVPSVTGEGTASDGKGNTKKVLFLSGGAGKPGWLDGVTKRASATRESLKKMMEPKPAPEKDPGAAPAEPKPSYSEQAAAAGSAALASTKSSLDAAGQKITSLMASRPKEDSPENAEKAEAPSEDAGRLAALRVAMGHMMPKAAPKEDAAVAELKAEVAALKETVAALAAKVEALENRAD